jgi:hypothetical protein
MPKNPPRPPSPITSPRIKRLAENTSRAPKTIEHDREPTLFKID